jgi:cytochrome c553
MELNGNAPRRFPCAHLRNKPKNASSLPRCDEQGRRNSAILREQFDATPTTSLHKINFANPNLHLMTTTRRIITLALATAALSTYGTDAASNWKQSCAKCHGQAGAGDTKMGHKLGIINLTDPAAQAKFTDEDAFKAMKNGRVDANGKITMKAIGGLSDDDMKALVPYVRSLKK